MFRKIFYGISFLALLVIAGGYGFLRTKLPQRSGEVSSGPSTRRVIDFGDAENSTGISPTGQSGYFFDQHYQDQTPLYLAGKSRRQIINHNRIPGNKKSQLIFHP